MFFGLNFFLSQLPRYRCGNLQHSSRPPSWNKGDPLLREGEGRKGRGKKWVAGYESREGEEGKGRESEEGREGKGRLAIPILACLRRH